MKFRSKKPHYEYLRKKWTASQMIAKDNFWDAHGQLLKQLGISYLSRDDVLKNYDVSILLAQQLFKELPKEIRQLDPEEEQAILEILSEDFGFRITAEIDNLRFNRNFGLIGGEQHLYRYPGDNLYAHADSVSDWGKYGSAGIASTLGAWGYFANSKEEFTEKMKLREKYYLAIQIFLIPGYAENAEKFRDFFKFRKMLVINPKTGQAVVAVIGDTGSSEWIGKHLGGSPEVMDALGLAEGSRKGAAVYFFIDDDKDEIPLGPIEVTSRASHPEREKSPVDSSS